MGKASRHIISIAVAALVGLTACSAGDDDDASSAVEPAADGGVVAPEEAPAAEQPASDEAGVAPRQVPGQAIAIEARATLEAEDVRVAVDRVTTMVTAHGGRVEAADVDFAPATDDDDQDRSRATLVLEVPPGEMAGVADSLEGFGTVTSFDQLAEDVTDQLADLDVRIANVRASVERVRELYAEATDIDSIVRLEAELTSRETELETLLASQQALDDRVAMATLTVDVTQATGVADTADDRPGVVDAAAAGWGAFVGGLFAVVLVLAAIAPFVITALVLALLVLWLRQLVRRPEPATPPAPLTEAPREPEHASRQG